MSQSQLSQSQRKRKSRSQAEGTEDSTEKVSISDLTKKCVRFLLTRMSANTPIRRVDIVQNVFHEKPGKNFDVVLENARQTLKKLFGLDLEIIDGDTSNKKYFVSNCLPSDLIVQTVPNNMQTVITFLVLTHIFMSKNNSTDINLWQFLKEFGIQPETNISEIGNAKVFITQKLVKQHYVLIEDRPGEHADGEPKKRFRWGARADETISKMEILKFVTELYGSKDVKFWNDHYKMAIEQFAGCEVVE